MLHYLHKELTNSWEIIFCPNTFKITVKKMASSLSTNPQILPLCIEFNPRYFSRRYRDSKLYSRGIPVLFFNGTAVFSCGRNGHIKLKSYPFFLPQYLVFLCSAVKSPSSLPIKKNKSNGDFIVSASNTSIFSI